MENKSSPSQAADEMSVTEFERRERDRLQHKVAIYDALADWRERRLAKHHYYSQQVRRLVRTLVVPGSRCLEVGCGLGDLLASLDASRAVGLDVGRRGRQSNELQDRDPALVLTPEALGAASELFGQILMFGQQLIEGVASVPESTHALQSEADPEQRRCAANIRKPEAGLRRPISQWHAIC